jgi:hypothetical protein
MLHTISFQQTQSNYNSCCVEHIVTTASGFVRHDAIFRNKKQNKYNSTALNHSTCYDETNAPRYIISNVMTKQMQHRYIISNVMTKQMQH